MPDFNPRTRVGCDFINSRNGREAGYFNPRTRVGCDPSPFHHPSSWWNFNPRTRVGCDISLASSQGLYYIFQSTHPRGVRQLNHKRLSVALEISIHAPAWGATQTCRLDISAHIFQSTHPRGVRPKLAAKQGNPLEFQSTHPRGVRRVPSSPTLYPALFQSTHPRGVRRD